MNKATVDYNDTLLQLHDVCKSYAGGNETVNILRSVNLSLKQGQMIALVGASGCGKSTLLHIAGLLDTPDSGEVTINGQKTSKLSDKIKTKLRGNAIGFIFQLHHLWSEFNALENLIIGQRLNGINIHKATEKAYELLEEVGLTQRAKHMPAQLSGGERQRVAIARALANNPKILLADEPTGNLDPDNAEKIFALFQNLVDKYNLAVIIATHDDKIAKASDNILKM